MIEFQLVGIAIVGALLLILLIFVMLELHSSRMVKKMLNNTQLLDQELFLTEPKHKVEAALDNDSIPDMEGLQQTLESNTDEQIDTIVKLTYDRKTNRLMVDSATVVRFMICMILMKFNKLDNKSVVRNMMVWLADKMFATRDAKQTNNKNVK